MELKKRILVAPLNWGLGHATRCIPIINALLEHDFEPITASDGDALALLKKEFPTLKTIELPSYNITYSKKGKDLKFKLLKDSPKLLKAIKAEKKLIKIILKEHQISGIISDNRFGVYNKSVPSVYITHQLNVLSGISTWFSSKMHQKIIRKFDECWIPDFKNEPSLSGILGHIKQHNFNVKYIGPLSRFDKIEYETTNALLVLLSGPEPQRNILEKKLLEELKGYKGSILFVKGVIESKQTVIKKDNITIYNFMTSTNLEKAINRSKTILSRSGYTTIMDLSKLEKKVFFIPTPGQFEQEYLAKRLNELKLAPSCNQKQFKVDMLNKIEGYKGLNQSVSTVNYKELFSLF